MRQSQGIGHDPITLFERRVDNGRMWMLGASLGLSYRADDWRAMLTYTGAYAEVNDAFSNLGEPGPHEPGGPGRRLRAQGFLALCFERDW